MCVGGKGNGRDLVRYSNMAIITEQIVWVRMIVAVR
jgi:hypothetical protein